jgi:hypothetical protein
MSLFLDGLGEVLLFAFAFAFCVCVCVWAVRLRLRLRLGFAFGLCVCVCALRLRLRLGRAFAFGLCVCVCVCVLRLRPVSLRSGVSGLVRWLRLGWGAGGRARRGAGGRIACLCMARIGPLESSGRGHSEKKRSGGEFNRSAGIVW